MISTRDQHIISLFSHGALTGLASNGDPVLVITVVEVDSGHLVLLKVIELLAVGVGEEEEVRARALGYSHRTSYGLE